MNKVILIGAGGHSRVIIDILKLDIIGIYGIIDNDKTKENTELDGIKIIGSDDLLIDIFNQGIKNAFVCIGTIGNNEIRNKLYEKAKSLGFNLINAIHPKSIIADNLVLGQGNAIMAGTIVNTGVTLGSNIVLNTGCIIEHDVVIEDNVFVGPGAVIGGGVSIGENAFIGLGAKIIQGVTIGSNSVVGAGSVVINDISENTLNVGVPAKTLKTL